MGVHCNPRCKEASSSQFQSVVGGQGCGLWGLWTRVMEAMQQLDARDREVGRSRGLPVMNLGPSLFIEGVQIIRLSFGLLGAKPLLPQEVCRRGFRKRRCVKGLNAMTLSSFA